MLKKFVVQIVKWIILFFIIGAIIPKECVAARNVTSQSSLFTNTETLSTPDRDVFHSLMSILLINIGDLTDNSSHTNLDKKVFLRLYFYLRHSRIYTPQLKQKNFISREFLFPGPNDMAYYVYSLHKIII